MEYKRLTNKNLDEYNPEIDFCSDCKYYGEPNGCNRLSGTCDNYDRFLETYNRLCELEDKIGNKTLLDLPCKAGDTVYEANKKNMQVYKHSIYQVILRGCIIVCWLDGQSSKDYGYLYSDTFLTREEAEAKLKELKEKK